MLERLFDCPRILMRQRAAPLLEERLQYLCHFADQGITRRVLQEIARSLLVIAEVLRLAGRPGEIISLSEIGQLALLGGRQAVRNNRPGPRVRRRRFASIRPTGSASWAGWSHTAILPTPMRRRSLLTGITSAERRNWLPKASTVSP